MATTKSSPVDKILAVLAEAGPAVPIGDDDKHLVTLAEVRDFSHRLPNVLEFAEGAEMRVSRLESADLAGELGGWPEGFAVSTEAFAACQLLADALDSEAERMRGWAESLRRESAYLYWVRGPGGDEA